MSQGSCLLFDPRDLGKKNFTGIGEFTKAKGDSFKGVLCVQKGERCNTLFIPEDSSPGVWYGNRIEE